MNRNQKITQISIVAILSNLALSAVKFFVGFVSGSQAVLSDAANSLGDAFSSLLTIIGTKLAAKAPDKKHPFGYGRIEYLTDAVVAFIVLYVGVEAVFDSISAIRSGEVTTFTPMSLGLVALGVIVKLVLGLWMKKQGKAIHSDAVEASGADAISDTALSLATLVSALLSYFFHIEISGWLGLLISLFILKTGIELLRSPLDQLVGLRADETLTRDVRSTIESFEGVEGAYDLILNSYGETLWIGSAHIQVPDTMTAREIQKLTREISQEIYRRYHIIMTVGVYASNTSDPVSRTIRQSVEEIVKDDPQIVQMHGFYVEPQARLIAFDLVLGFGAKGSEIRKEILDRLETKFPGYRFDIVLDGDFSD